MSRQNQHDPRPPMRSLLQAFVLLAVSVFVFAATLGVLAAGIWYGGGR